MNRFWDLLSQHKKAHLQIITSFESGKGNVEIVHHQDQVIFHESGQWESSQILFKNTLSWTLKGSLIALQHQRQGSNNPILLSHLALFKPDYLTATTPHCCHQDTYLCQIHFLSSSFHLRWIIKGPKKDQLLDCIYTF